MVVPCGSVVSISELRNILLGNDHAQIRYDQHRVVAIAPQLFARRTELVCGSAGATLGVLQRRQRHQFYLGVDISDVTTERLSALKLKEEKGVEVTMVDQDAPAGKAGIKEHDVILTMNGTAIEWGAVAADDPRDAARPHRNLRIEP